MNQYMNVNEFSFDGTEWRYNGLTFDSIKMRVMATRVNFGGPDSPITDILLPDSVINRSRFDGREYASAIYKSMMNLWLHYNLGQLFLVIEKYHAISESELEDLSPKERSKLLRENEKKILSVFTEKDKDYI